MTFNNIIKKVHHKGINVPMWCTFFIGYVFKTRKNLNNAINSWKVKEHVCWIASRVFKNVG